MDPVPLKYRLLLIVLLPLITAVLYVRGQRYDPALIDFKTAMGEDGAGHVLLHSVQEPQSSSSVHEIAGFRQLGVAHQYTQENLYEHVDGHAEFFIGAGFQRLTVTEYAGTSSKAGQAEIQVEVFDMGKSIQAFGVLADESGENPAPVSVGSMGYKTTGGVNFIKGRYYVKISAFNTGAPVLEFAKGFADTLSTGPDSFRVFSKFPDLGNVENTRFVKEGYRGLDFLHNVIERGYVRGGEEIKVALMAGSEQDTGFLMTTFLDYFGRSGIRYEKINIGGKEVYSVMDKYEGNWFLIPLRDTVFGVFGTDDEEILKFFVKG